jgi:hypothetical protein
MVFPLFLSRLVTGTRALARRLEMDRAVSYVLLARAWAFVAGPVSGILIATHFTPATQGFYYTFGSILALQTFAELGIGVAITQFASHEWANLRIGPDRRIEGDADSLSRLASLASLALRWYAIVAFVAAVGLGIAGYVFFSQSPAQEVNWKLPWISLCVLSGMTLPTVAIWSLLEGCNQVANVYLFRFFQGFCSTLVVWTAILSGAGLWAASLMSLAGLAVAGAFLRRRYWTFFKSLMSVKADGPRVSWRQEILPFQWRIAVSWISGYFIFSLFTPVLFHYHGAVVAGQMGMTWSLVSVDLAKSAPAGHACCPRTVCRSRSTVLAPDARCNSHDGPGRPDHPVTARWPRLLSTLPCKASSAAASHGPLSDGDRRLHRIWHDGRLSASPQARAAPAHLCSAGSAGRSVHMAVGPELLGTWHGCGLLGECRAGLSSDRDRVAALSSGVAWWSAQLAG